MTNGKVSKAADKIDSWAGLALSKSIAVLATIAAVIAGYIAWGAWTTDNVGPAVIASALCAGALWLARDRWRSRQKASDYDWMDVGPGSSHS
jgi:Ni/Fe-hydrogenase subunit HybB-like protein